MSMPRSSQMAAAIAITLTFTAVSGASTPQPNSLESLRRAVLHIQETFGDEYPHGNEYLERLDAITDASSDAYKQLQREALLNHPHVRGYRWLVEVRDQYWGNHGPINTMFQNGDIHHATGGIHNWRSLGGRLEVIAIGDQGVVTCQTILAAAPQGVLRDADVRFDGRAILFSMRRNKQDDYHLYEKDLESGDLRQLTHGPMISDVDPMYLPDGRVLFSSTRDPKFCQCNRHISLNLFRMEADGGNIEQISRNNLADFHASLMPDGRVIYSRWEYVDRHFGPSLGLWTCNPDGVRHELFMGNNAWSPGAMVDARVIPGTNLVLCVYGACHDLPWGAMAVVDRSQGMEGVAPVVHMWPEHARELISPDDDQHNRSLQYRGQIDAFKRLSTRYEDPYPVHDVEQGTGGGAFFLASKLMGPFQNNQGKTAIVLCDVFGNEIVVYETADSPLGAYGAVPIAARHRPRVIPDEIDYSQDHGYLYVNDVYQGTGDEMIGVQRGAIKWLRIIEAPPRRTWDERGYWNVDAQQVAAMNWNLTNNKRILGDAPVEEDGSAYFKLPADTFVQIHALDADKQMVQAMRTGTIVRPGETQGCIGCHENRLSTPRPMNFAPLAMKRSPSDLTPWLDTPSVAEAKPFNYLTDVQPVFDRHCVSCHDYDQPAGDVLNLCGDLSYPFNVSYLELMQKSGARYTGAEEKLVSFVGDGPPGVLPAYAWGSHRSKLVRVLKEGHYDVRLSADDMHRIVSWIDVNAVYYGRYESYYPGRNPLAALENGQAKLKRVLGDKTGGRFVSHTLEHGYLVNFTRPEKSPVLALIDDDAQRQQALAYLQEAAELLMQTPREDQTNAGVARSEVDLHNETRLNATRAENAKSIEAILRGEKHYQFR